MTSSEPDTAIPSSAPETVEEINSTPDPFLAALAAYAIKNESFELGLTLHVSGVVVSGVMISPAAFFDHLADWVAERGAGEFGESLARPMAQMFRDGAADQQADDDAPIPVNFIHLRHGQVFAPGLAEPLPPAPWRGRLSHVSGWSIGNLAVGQIG